jgi:hypothetical protein
LEWTGDRADDVVQFDDGGEQWRRLDTHEHHPIAEPLGDAHTPTRADVTQEGSECGENIDRMLVPVELGEGGESGDIDEGKATMDAHRLIVSRHHQGIPIGGC